jgi:hypothetical protein
MSIFVVDHGRTIGAVAEIYDQPTASEALDISDQELPKIPVLLLNPVHRRLIGYRRTARELPVNLRNASRRIGLRGRSSFVIAGHSVCWGSLAPSAQKDHQSSGYAQPR